MRPLKSLGNLFDLLVVFFTISIVAIASIADEAEGIRDWSAYPMQSGRFRGTWDSLDKYEYPEWFRDAKFGIWAIIGPQCVPMQGDWYARHMYIQGHRQYEHHVKTYGHPSKFGYKDLIRTFDPKKLDFDKLVGLYKRAGARYAVILAVHHDNFDLWNSKHHEWNSVHKGPKRDLVGEFRDAAAKHDIRFGVTTHLARTYSWLQTSHGADKEGPLAGVPYDGADPNYQSLYHPPFPESARYPSNPPEAWKRLWYLRVKDLVDQYRPDVMYFDGGYPFDKGNVGRRLVAHYYNANTIWHNGRNDAAMCIKKWPEGSGHGVFRDGTCIQDIERGRADTLRELPWQTDTCIGGWYYRVGTKYKTPTHVAHMLIDIVSKNGNLLLNLPLHPDGSLDEDEIAFLEAMGRWMEINGEGIYETRPWLVFGEGPAKGGGGHFNEAATNYTSRDFRYTSRGDRRLYAFFMKWPDSERLNLQALAKSAESSGVIERVELLGREDALQFEQSDEGLMVKLPPGKPCEHAWALRITGLSLRDFKPQEFVYVIEADNEGSFLLNADEAEIHGASPRVEKKPTTDKCNIGFWDSANDWISWRLRIPNAGIYLATARISSSGHITRFAVELDDQRIEAESIKTLGWDRFVPVRLGLFRVDKPRICTLSVKPLNAETWKPIGLLEVKLTPTSRQDPVEMRK